MSTGKGTAKHKERGGRKMVEVAGVAPPDLRKFEEDRKAIVERIIGLEDKIKPMPSNTTQQLGTEITKEAGKVTEMERARESKIAELRAAEAKIKEVGHKYSEQKRETSDLLAGVRHKTESRHDEAVEKLEQQMKLRRLSSSEEMKFKQEVDALKKSRERLGEWLAAKHKADVLKTELNELRKQRDSLHVMIKENRSNELRLKDKITRLRRELEEAKERKKISITEKDQLRKEIESLHEQRKKLFDTFRAEELAYVSAVEQSKKEEKQRRAQERVQSRVDREKMRAMSRDFLQKQQYEEKTSTCRMLVTHLQKLSQATQSPADAEEDQASMNPSFTPLLERVPRRAESDPIGSPGAFLLRRDKEEMLFVPSASSLTRRRSKKEKRRNAPVVKVSKPLQLNATIFKQFSNLGLSPPNTFSDIPSVIAQLNDRLAYFEGMVKDPRLSREFLELVLDSGLGSSAPSEILDVADRYMEFTSSQEDATLQNLDPGLDMTTPNSFKTSYSEVPDIPDNSDCSTSTIMTSEEDSISMAVENGKTIHGNIMDTA